MEILFRRRDPSPIFATKEIKSKTEPSRRVRTEEKELLQNGFYFEREEGERTRNCKINRIPMISTALVQVVAVHSPSLIFVRIDNHIRENLILREPAEVAPLHEEELQLFSYVLCPIEERAYGRARILDIETDELDESKKLVQLILIDDGKIVWADSSSLVSMDPVYSPGAKDLAYHPWQIQAVSLAGISPKTTPRNREHKWSPSVIKRLQKICNGFTKFKARAVTLSVTTNDYGVATAVALFGFNVQKEDEEVDKRSKSHAMPEEVDIGSLLSGSMPAEVEITRLYDGKKQQRFERSSRDFTPEESEKRFVEDFRKQKIPSWKGKLREDEQRADDWVKSLNEVEIKDMSIGWLRSQKYEFATDALGERIFVCLEGAYTISPMEFYGRPIKMFVEKKEEKKTEGQENTDGEEVNPAEESANSTVEEIEGKDGVKMVKLGEADAMLKGNTILKNHAAVLDAFYSKDGNRKQVPKQEIERALTEDGARRVYTMCQSGDSRAQYTGTWQRVEVLHTMDYSVIVRFLDSGGTDMVQYGALFHIHPDHTMWPALCIQLCIHGMELEGEGTETWTEGGTTKKKKKSLEKFRSLMREDLPMSMSIYPDSFIPRDGFRRDMERRAYEREGVIFVQDIKVQGKDCKIIDSMCREGMAKRRSSYPFNLKVKEKAPVKDSDDDSTA
ncbi:hypothetical protein PMAYCL1PPCAC_18683 [Pristionchus mayeri]|uniref:Tudor domain-containing protein n=1 Tax=Pristionchus mayeri TaxID=1317129 RepID=A0AAN5CQ27_9BILA|nr:hypothetical protein PMAYCL1PPCAC_18683 [Pristionchus mayeri]